MSRRFQGEPAVHTRRLRKPGRAAGTVIAGTLLAGLLAAGCGGSRHSTASTPPAAITKAEFVTKANEICGGADPALSLATAKLANLHSETQLAAVVRGTFVPSIEAQMSQIRTLGTPPGDQATVQSMLDMALADLQKLKSNPALVNTDAFADFAKVAHAYGLTACAPTS
ncbi:MAG: hypothetical protein ACLQMH_05910 [Solirubrobacteraceae bacterium]